VVYERYVPAQELATIPFAKIGNVTTLIGFWTIFLQGLITVMVIYYLPVYFQAVKGDSPIRAGVNGFSLSFTIAPFAVLVGLWISKSGKYRIQNYIGWALIVLGTGLMSLITSGSPLGAWVGFPLVLGIGLGFIQTGSMIRQSNFLSVSPSYTPLL